MALLLALFVVTSWARFRVHPSGGHTHRQTDTLGMAVAFAEEWRARGLEALDFFFYPRVLQRGLQDGINASEYPLLNVLGGFLFLGGDPRLGVFLLALFVLMVNLLVAAIWLPRFLRAFGVEVSALVALLVWFSGHGTAYQATVVMPEGLALPLALVGVTLLIEARAWPGLAAGGVACGLAAGVKPTAAIALGAIPVLLLLVPEQRRRWRSLLLPLVAGLAFAVWWYTEHARHIVSIAQGPQVFAAGRLDPIANLASLGAREILALLIREPHQGQLPMFVGWWFPLVALALGEWRFALVYLAALLGVMALGGPAVVVHAYYFVGASVFAMVLMSRVLGAAQDRPWLRRITLVALVWGLLWGIRVNVWLAAHASDRDHLWALGRAVRERVAPDVHLLTDDGPYPLKLLFVGRSGTTAGESLYALGDRGPYRTRALALLARTPPPDSGFLPGRVVERGALRSPAETWHLTLVAPGGP